MVFDKDNKAFYKDQTPNNTEEIELTEINSYVAVSDVYKNKEYEDKLKALNLSKIQTNKVYKGIKKIFNKTNPKDKNNSKLAEICEGFYALDLNNLDKTFYNGLGKSAGVVRPKELTQYILAHPEADVVTIHNHRGDNLPSFEDIKINIMPNSHRALIVGNNGSIFYIDTRKANKDLILAKFKFEEYPRGEGKEEKFKELCNKYNIKFVCIRKENEQK